MFDFIENIKTTVTDAAASKALGEIRDRVLNPAVAEIGTIKEIGYKNKKLLLVCELAGMEGQDIEVSACSVKIADDGSYIELADFDSNRAFASNALNMFASRRYDMPEGGMVRYMLITAKKLLGL